MRPSNLPAATDLVVRRGTWTQAADGSPAWRTTTATAATATLLAVGLAACGTDGSSKGSPDATASSAAAPSSKSAANSAGATSLKTVSTGSVQIKVPSDWNVSQESNGPAGTAPPPAGSANPPAVFSLDSSTDPLATTDSAAQTALRHAGKNGKHLSDLRVNGVTLYHVQYTTPGFFRDSFGVAKDGVFYEITWNFGTEEGITRAKADAYMNPVMATFKLTS